MHAGSFIQDGKRVEISRTPVAEYRDPIVLDEITQYFNGYLYKVWPSSPYYSKGSSRLHRDVWAFAFGPIPNGCHIHHKDGNSANNVLSNLECMDAKEHLQLSWATQSRTDKAVISESARQKAAAWHSSDEGRLWHKRHAEKIKLGQRHAREERKCLHCGVEFMGIVRAGATAQKYCSDVCKVAAYRQRGADKEATARYRQRQKDNRAQ